MLTNDEFNKICRLARLKISEANMESFLSKLNGIFDWVRQLQDINTDNIEIKDIVENSTQSSREDIVISQSCRSDVLLNTKCKKFDMFSVPKVVE